tara:strand:- start:2135 stop:2851 length:717 start_codon:yes stop_codon:yes gene_type:complete
MRVGFLIIIFETALLLLAFLPYAEEDTTRYVELISYLSLILPLYVAIQRKFWNFISLLSLTAVIHIIRDLCGSFDTCLNKYEDLKWNTLDDYFTLYAILHVMAVVAFLNVGLEITLPLLVFVTVLSTNMEMQATFTLIIAVVCLTTCILRLKDYHLQDLIAFWIVAGVAITTHFLETPRFFIILFSLTFAFATSVHKSDDQKYHFLGVLETSSAAYTKVAQTIESTRNNLLSRVDIES